MFLLVSPIHCEIKKYLQEGLAMFLAFFIPRLSERFRWLKPNQLAFEFTVSLPKAIDAKLIRAYQTGKSHSSCSHQRQRKTNKIVMRLSRWQLSSHSDKGKAPPIGCFRVTTLPFSRYIPAASNAHQQIQSLRAFKRWLMARYSAAWHGGHPK